jgi:RNA polymerase sigma factor (sigma-70 family)
MYQRPGLIHPGTASHLDLCGILHAVQTRAAETDGELAEAIARGDAAAEAALYERFALRVRYLAQRQLRSRDLAQDACNETFARTIAAIRGGRLRSAESVASFLLQTSRYVVLEMLRQQRPGHVSLDEHDEDRLAAPVPEEVDESALAAVRTAIRDLAPRDRSFLRMYYYDELPKGEIAERLGISEERVRLIKSRALQRFRRVYEGQD